MTDLDSLARAATRELLDRTSPDLPDRFAELRRTRKRRTTAKVVAAAAAVTVVAGGWRLVAEPDRVEPAPPPPAKVVNGTLVAATFDGKSAMTSVNVDGPPFADPPRDMATFARLQFTSDGRSVVYPSSGYKVVAHDVFEGGQVTLADCLGNCDFALSRDDRFLAFATSQGIRVQEVGATSTELLPVEGATAVASPSWSPDGREIAFAGGDGIYVLTVDGGGVRLVYGSTDPGTNITDVSWSPDGSRIAFFDTRTVHDKSYAEDRFTAMTVRSDGSDPVRLHGAGQCFCAGLTPPTLTWSPESQYVAVATTKGAGPWGVYLAAPDGSSWEPLASGSFGHLAWQPVIE